MTQRGHVYKLNLKTALGITFDDVLLVPAYSEVIPNEVDLSTYLLSLIHISSCPL